MSENIDLIKINVKQQKIILEKIDKLYDLLCILAEKSRDITDDLAYAIERLDELENRIDEVAQIVIE